MEHGNRCNTHSDNIGEPEPYRLRAITETRQRPNWSQNGSENRPKIGPEVLLERSGGYLGPKMAARACPDAKVRGPFWLIKHNSFARFRLWTAEAKTRCPLSLINKILQNYCVLSVKRGLGSLLEPFYDCRIDKPVCRDAKNRGLKTLLKHNGFARFIRIRWRKSRLRCVYVLLYW